MRNLICIGQVKVSTEPHSQWVLWPHKPHHAVTSSFVIPIIHFMDNPRSCYLAVQGSPDQPIGVGLLILLIVLLIVNCYCMVPFC